MAQLSAQFMQTVSILMGRINANVKQVIQVMAKYVIKLLKTMTSVPLEVMNALLLLNAFIKGVDTHVLARPDMLVMGLVANVRIIT